MGVIFTSKQEQFTFNCTAIPLLFHVALTTVQVFIKLWDWLSCSLLTSVCGPAFIKQSVTTVSTLPSSLSLRPPRFCYGTENRW